MRNRLAKEEGPKRDERYKQHAEERGNQCLQFAATPRADFIRAHCFWQAEVLHRFVESSGARKNSISEIWIIWLRRGTSPPEGMFLIQPFGRNPSQVSESSRVLLIRRN